MRLKYYHDGKVIGFYELNGFPGCNQVAVSNHAWISPDQRGNGYGDAAHKQRLKEAQELGYDYIICTVDRANEVQCHILEKNNWYNLDDFVNRETGKTIKIYGKKLDSRPPVVV